MQFFRFWLEGGRYTYPIGSMYGIFTYIYHKNQPNVGKYTIHGSYGYEYSLIYTYKLAVTRSHNLLTASSREQKLETHPSVATF